MRKTGYEKLVEDIQVHFIKEKNRCMVVKSNRDLLLYYMNYGIYIKKSKCLINCSRFREASEEGYTNPKKMLKNYKKASETDKIKIISNNKIVIQLKSENSSCWIRLDTLRKFGTEIKLFIGTDREPVLITDNKDEPLGIIMPVMVK